MESNTAFTLSPGLYQLRFSLGNNADTNCLSTVNKATVSLGEVYLEGFAKSGCAPLEPVVRTIPVTTLTGGRLVFSQAGGDSHGLIVDDIRLIKRDTPSPLVDANHFSSTSNGGETPAGAAQPRGERFASSSSKLFSESDHTRTTDAIRYPSETARLTAGLKTRTVWGLDVLILDGHSDPHDEISACDDRPAP